MTDIRQQGRQEHKDRNDIEQRGLRMIPPDFGDSIPRKKRARVERGLPFAAHNHFPPD